jgi:hypothetical protein
MERTIDKISINDMMQGEDYCPLCQQEEIEELMSQLVLDDDIEEAVEYASDISKMCKNCRGDERSDFNRN